MKIIAIDPGTIQSAYVVWDGHVLSAKCIAENSQLLRMLSGAVISESPAKLVVEWVESYGMAVGQEVFQTCRWCGRFEEAWQGATEYRSRKYVKSHICGSTRATDANIRMALIDRFGAPGTNNMPNPITYGMKKDMWAAFALAVAYFDQECTKVAKEVLQ
jgi:hypothetical protein